MIAILSWNIVMHIVMVISLNHCNSDTACINTVSKTTANNYLVIIHNIVIYNYILFCLHFILIKLLLKYRTT